MTRPVNIARASDVLGNGAPRPSSSARSTDGRGALEIGGQRPRQKSTSGNGMNKTEAWFKREVIDQMPGVKWCKYEEIKLRLADRTWYTPDFVVGTTLGIDYVYEVKGSWKAPNQQKSRVKLKVAAEMHQQYKFFAAVPRKGGGWDIEEIPCRQRQ